MNFIKSRLNRDNLWNLLFFFGTVASVAFSEFLRTFESSIHEAGNVALFASFTIVPWLLLKSNAVTWNKGKVFFNKDGKNINNLPQFIYLILSLLGILISFCILPFLEDIILFDNFEICAMTGTFLLSPVLYFMLINCPISILINKHCWQPEVIGIDTDATYYEPTSSRCSDYEPSYNRTRSYNHSSSSNYSSSHYRRVERRDFYSTY